MGESKRRPDADSSDRGEPTESSTAAEPVTSRLRRLKAKVKHLQEEDPNVYPSW